MKNLINLVLTLFLSMCFANAQNNCANFYNKWVEIALNKSTHEARVECQMDCESENLAKLFFMAFSYYLDEDPDSSMYYISKISKTAPTDSLFYLESLVKRIWDDTLETRKALFALNKAIEISPNNALYLCDKAEIILELEGSFEEAISFFTKSIKADSTYIPAQLGMAGVLMAQEKRAEANKWVYKAINLEPDNPNVYLYAARVMRQGDLWIEGMNYLDTALFLDSTFMDAYLERADMFLEVEEPLNAIVNYDQAIFHDPNAHDIYLLRGDAMLEIEEYDLSLNDFKKYLSIYPTSTEAISGMADSYYLRGMFDSAIVQYQLLPPGYENDPEIAFGKAQCYAELGNFDEAYRLFGVILKNEPNNNFIYVQRGKLYMQQNKPYEAEKDFKKAIQIDPTQVEVFYLHCQAAYGAEYFKDACESCKQATFYGVKGIDKKYMKSCGK